MTWPTSHLTTYNAFQDLKLRDNRLKYVFQADFHAPCYQTPRPLNRRRPSAIQRAQCTPQSASIDQTRMEVSLSPSLVAVLEGGHLLPTYLFSGRHPPAPSPPLKFITRSINVPEIRVLSVSQIIKGVHESVVLGLGNAG